MTDNTQPEALRLANEFKLCDEYDSIPSINDIAKAEAELRRQHARIAELEAQLESAGFTAADMATAAAQGFRDGVASCAASAGSEPVAWQYRSVRDKGLWFDCTEERAKQRAAHPETWDVRYLYTHPSLPEGMVAAQALRKVLSVVQRYLPPDGPTANDAMTEITEIVDPWPLGPLEKP